jgi:trk system potassium uptake protein TrkH
VTTNGARRGRFAPRIVGTGLLALSAALVVFGTVAFLAGHGGGGFLTTAAVAAPVGALLWRVGSARGEPSRREALLSVLLLWLVVPVVGAWPYVADGGMSVVDALFESMSGFTATGATALSDFGAFGPELFLWRAFSQWVGGIGIIVLFIAVFPQLAIAGRQLFFAETPGPTEHRLTPRLRNTASAVMVVYASLTVAAILAYLATGLGPYDALAHALTTVAAAGFSPEARSFEGFGAGPQWVAIVFMTLAGVNFALQSRAFAGRPRTLLNDAEFRTYLAIALTAGLALAWLIRGDTAGGLEALRHGLFQSLSILTTTGYASVDYATWSSSAQAILVLLMFVGGSAGSAAGGVKVVRLMIAGKNTAREVRRALHPRAILPLRVGARTVPDEVLRAVAAFLTLYAALFVAIATALALQGLDFTTAFTAAIATLGNVGPGLGMVGPMGSYGDLPAASRVLLTFAMYAGRLEVVAVFVVFTPDWWKVPRGVRSRLWGWAFGRRAGG